MQATEAEIRDSVKKYILNEFLPGESEDALDDSVLLVTDGILDSIATARLVAFLEETYGIEIPAHELSARYLDTLDSIARLVHDKSMRS